MIQNVGSTLWLHPISSFKYLKDVNLNIIDDCVRYELVTNNFGIDYPNHIKELKKRFAEGNLKIARLEDEEYKLEQKSLGLLASFYEDANDSNSVSHAYLNQSEELCKVFVSCADTPGQFFVQNEYSYNLLGRLNAEIKAFITKVNLKQEKKLNTEFSHNNNNNSNNKKKKDDEYDEEQSLDNYLTRSKEIHDNFTKEAFDFLVNAKKKALYCLAKQGKENDYNRAKIIDYFKAENACDNKIKVFFVDYGDHDWVKLSDILPLNSNHFKILPFQAIECSLNGIAPVDHLNLNCSNWSTQSGDQLWSLTHDEENYHCSIYARVVETNVEADSKKYLIRLFKKSLPTNLDISHKLVALNCAKLLKNEEAKLFSLHESDQNKVLTNPLSSLLNNFILNFIG